MTEGARLIVPLHPKRRAGMDFFMVPGLGGHVLSAQVLTSGVPEPWVGHGILYPSFVPAEPSYPTFEAMAARLIEDVLKKQRHGPYLFVGYSMGGLLAVELARQLIQAGHRAGIVLIDVRLFQHAPLKPFYSRWPRKAYWMARGVWARLRALGSKRDVRMSQQRRLSHEPGEARQLPPSFARALDDGRAALNAYQLKPVSAPSFLIRCTDLAWWDALRDWTHDYGWSLYTDNRGVRLSPGDHLGMVQGANLPGIGEAMGQALAVVYEAAEALPVSVGVRQSDNSILARGPHEESGERKNQTVPQS